MDVTLKKALYLIFSALLAILVFGLTVTPLAQATLVNLVPNPSVETASSNPTIPLSWQKGGSGTNTRILTYPVTGFTTPKAVKTEITSYTSGDAKWYFNQIPVTPGATYTFKDVYTSTTTSYVTFRYTLQNGTYMYPDLEKNIPAAPTWTTFQKNFVVPTTYTSPVTHVTMFHLIKSVGSITIDDNSIIQVDTTGPTVTVDAIQNQPVLGTVMLNATASDNDAIASVQFFIDENAVGSLDTEIPYTYDLDTTLYSNGNHTITAQATDVTENKTTSLGVPLSIQNAPTSGTVTILKHVINDNGGIKTSSDFSLHLKNNGVDITGSPFLGNETGTNFNVGAGTYTINEAQLGGYTFTGFTGDCDATGTLSVLVGETKICTLTNDDTPPPTGTLTVMNVIINDNGATKTLADFPLFIDADNVVSGTPNIIATGEHAVSEITDPNYTKTYSGDCDVNGIIFINANDIKTCTITNDDIAAVPPVTTPNVVPNPSVETQGGVGLPASWFKGGSGTNTRVLTYPVSGYDGVRAVKTEITSYTSGDAKWYFNYVPASSGQQYIFSDFYISNTTSYVTMQYKLSDGTFKYQDIILSIPASASWANTSKTFTIPTYTLPVVSMSAFHLIKSVGYVTVDNYSIQQAPPVIVDPTNLIANPSLESVSSSNSDLPYGWSRTASTGITATFSYTNSPLYDGLKSVTVSASEYTSGAGAKWYFTQIPVVAGEEYRFTDYYTGTASGFVTAQFTLSNGTYQYTDLTRLTPSATWKNVSVTFVVPENAVSVTVLHGIKSAGTLTTDAYSLRKLSSGVFAQGMVSLNFDDGLGSVYRNAMLILQNRNIKSSHYIISGEIGNNPTYMTKPQITTINQAGNEIGSHARTHPQLTLLSTEEAQAEIAGSRSDLTALGFTPNTVFVYPYGDFNDAVRQQVIDAGFVGARSVQRGYNTKNTDKYLLRDQSIEINTTFEQIKTYIDTAIANKTWLILEFHDTNNSGDQYSNTPELLTQVADYITANNIPIVTTAEGIALME